VFFSFPSPGDPSVILRILENFTLYLRNSLSLNLRAIENCICGLRSIGRKMRFILRTVYSKLVLFMKYALHVLFLPRMLLHICCDSAFCIFFGGIERGDIED
jgi:hypothetical protein